MVWSKKMSRTDAMQPTRGWPVPYMRFTKSGNPQDNQTWFRHVLLGNANWQPGVFGNHQVEQCIAPIDITILGQHKGIRNFMITHDPNRSNNNNTPNTYLHYDAATQSDFSQVNVTNHQFEIRLSGTQLEIDIS